MDSRFTESGVTNYVTAAGGAEQKKVVKAGAGKAFSIDAVNIAGGDRFLYVFDNTSDAGTALACPPFKIPTGGFVSIQWASPLLFATGLTVASSSTQGTYTAAAADLMMRVSFK